MVLWFIEHMMPAICIYLSIHYYLYLSLVWNGLLSSLPVLWSSSKLNYIILKVWTDESLVVYTSDPKPVMWIKLIWLAGQMHYILYIKAKILQKPHKTLDNMANDL